MSEYSYWILGNWYELGSLLVQSAILAVVVWFGRKALRAIWTLQAQNGAITRLAMADLNAEQTAAEHVAPAGKAPYQAPRKSVSVFAAVGSALRGVVRWLQAPTGSGRRRPVMQA